MSVISRQVKNKRDANGVLTGRPGTVYDVNIKYKYGNEWRQYAKKGFATKKDAQQHEAEMKTNDVVTDISFVAFECAGAKIDLAVLLYPGFHIFLYGLLALGNDRWRIARRG